MSTPFPQSSLDQAARDAAANKPQSILDKWKSKIMEMPGFQKPAPAPTSSQAQTVRDAQAAKDAIKKLNAGSTAVSLAGGSVSAAVTAPLMLGGSEDRSRKWSRLGYSSPEAYQKAVSQNANRERPLGSDNSVPSPTNNKPNNASEINARLAQQRKEKEAALAVTKGNYDHSSGSYTGQDVALVPDSTLNNGRDNSRTNPNGIVQKGTDMSRSFNDLLNDVTSNKGTGFSSEQLAGTASNPFSNSAPETQAFNAAAPGVTGNSYDNYGAAGGVAAASSTDRSQFTPMSGKEERIGGASDRPGEGTLAAALADKDGINSYMSKFSSEDKNMARRRAFLDGEDSYKGLKAREALDGYVHAGGKYYAQDGEKATELKFGDNRKIARGESSAQDLLKSYTQSIQQSASETAAQQQDPPETFNTDSGITASNPGASGFSLEGNDFKMNNDDGGGFAAPKGYKAQSTYKDPAFPNPFAK